MGAYLSSPQSTCAPVQGPSTGPSPVSPVSSPQTESPAQSPAQTPAQSPDLADIALQYQVALVAAAGQGDHARVLDLLRSGASVNFCDADGHTALHKAAAAGHARVVQVLIKWKADVNSVGKIGVPALIKACQALANSEHLPRAGQPWHAGVVEQLLAAGARVAGVTTRKGATALHLAAGACHPDSSRVCELLLQAGGADVNALMFLPNKANLNIMDTKGFTPLYIAVMSRSPECVSVLLKHGADVDHITYYGAALHAAGSCEMVEMLLAAGADVRAVDMDGQTPLYIAASSGRAEVAKVLLAAGADVNTPDKHGFTPLHVATKQGYTDVASLLLKAPGIAIDAQAASGITPLHCAARQQQPAVLGLLLQAGADVYAVAACGEQALHCAVTTGNKQVVQQLLAAGAHKEEGLVKGLNSLAIAAGKGYVSVVQMLQAAGVRSSVSLWPFSHDALKLAVKSGNFTMVSALLDDGRSTVSAQTLKVAAACAMSPVFMKTPCPATAITVKQSKIFRSVFRSVSFSLVQSLISPVYSV